MVAATVDGDESTIPKQDCQDITECAGHEPARPGSPHAPKSGDTSHKQEAFHTALSSKDPPRVESLNALNSFVYFSNLFPHTSLTIPHIQPSAPTSKSIEPQNVHLERKFARDMTLAELSRCLSLIAGSSKEDYRNSSTGWSPAKKDKEMRLPDLRYILLKAGHKIEPHAGNASFEASDEINASQEQEEEEEQINGFASFMLTYEDGVEVIYLYEIHLAVGLRGQRVGGGLIGLIEEAGRSARMQKIMLTVFRANKRAVQFYERMGYAEDEYSPRARKMRGGVVKEPDYVILSKTLVTKATTAPANGKRRKGS